MKEKFIGSSEELKTGLPFPSLQLLHFFILIPQTITRNQRSFAFFYRAYDRVTCDKKIKRGRSHRNKELDFDLKPMGIAIVYGAQTPESIRSLTTQVGAATFSKSESKLSMFGE